MHVCHVGNTATSFSIAVKVTDTSVQVRGRHRSERLLVNQLHGAVTICHCNVLEQSLRCGRVALLRGCHWSSVGDRKLWNGN